MVRLTRIYTRTGDDGTTGLGDFSRIPKTDVRLAAYADVNEANAAIGVAIAGGDLRAESVAVLSRIQNDLFDVGADLSTPLRPVVDRAPLRVTQEWIVELEQACDERNVLLPNLESFVLPGGTSGAALLHLAATVVRRAERSTWAAVEAYGTEPSEDGPGGVNPLTGQYLNRLSDLLFIMARQANMSSAGDVLWRPGGGRPSLDSDGTD